MERTFGAEVNVIPQSCRWRIRCYGIRLALDSMDNYLFYLGCIAITTTSPRVVQADNPPQPFAKGVSWV